MGRGNRRWDEAMQRRSQMRIRDFQGRFMPGPHTSEDLDLARLERLRAELAAIVPFGYPTSGNPNIIGEHEVEPVRCGCCSAIIPWAVIKGWRD